MLTEFESRIVGLPEMIRERQQRRRREDAERYRRHTPRYTAADRRFHAHIYGPHGRKELWPLDMVVKETGESARNILRWTEGQDFRLDFGRSYDGQQLTFFYQVGMVKWARQRKRLLVRAGAIATRIAEQEDGGRPGKRPAKGPVAVPAVHLAASA